MFFSPSSAPSGLVCSTLAVCQRKQMLPWPQKLLQCLILLVSWAKDCRHLSQAAYASLRAAEDTRQKPSLRRITLCPKNNLTTGDIRSASNYLLIELVLQEKKKSKRNKHQNPKNPPTYQKHTERYKSHKDETTHWLIKRGYKIQWVTWGPEEPFLSRNLV